MRIRVKEVFYFYAETNAMVDRVVDVIKARKI